MKNKEENQISISNSIIYRKAQIWKTEQFASFGLTAAQIPIVIITCRENGISQNELSEMLSMDKSTIAKIVVNLVKDEYLIRNTKSKDKRAFDLIPTQKARIAYPRLLEILNLWNDLLTADMSKAEKEMLELLLSKVAQNAVNSSKELSL